MYMCVSVFIFCFRIAKIILVCTAGTFNLQHEEMDTGKVWQGVIKYSITAFLEAPENSPERRGAVKIIFLMLSDVFMFIEMPLVCLQQAEVPVIVYDKLECRNAAALPDRCSAMGSVRTFFCIHRGNVNVSSR